MNIQEIIKGLQAKKDYDVLSSEFDNVDFDLTMESDLFLTNECNLLHLAE